MGVNSVGTGGRDVPPDFWRQGSKKSLIFTMGGPPDLRV